MKFIFVFLSVCNLCFLATAVGGLPGGANSEMSGNGPPAKKAKGVEGGPNQTESDSSSPLLQEVVASQEKKDVTMTAGVGVEATPDHDGSNAGAASSSAAEVPDPEQLEVDSDQGDSSRPQSPELVVSQKAAMTAAAAPARGGGGTRRTRSAPAANSTPPANRTPPAPINLASTGSAGVGPVQSPADKGPLPIFSHNDIPIETVQQFIVEYSKPSFMNKAGWGQEELEIDSFFELGGVLQPYLNHVAYKIREIVQEHKRTLNAFICYKWPDDMNERTELQRKIKLMRTFFRGSGLAATMDIVDNDSGNILEYRKTLEKTRVIIVPVTEKFIKSALDWRKEKEEQAQVSTAAGSGQKNNLWLELDAIQARLDLEGRQMPGGKQQLIYPLLMEDVMDASNRLNTIWDPGFIYHDILGETKSHALPEFIIKVWSNHFSAHGGYCKAINDITEGLEREKKTYNDRLKGVKKALEAIKGGASSGASADSDAADGSKKSVKPAAILSSQPESSVLHQNLKSCLNSYRAQQKIEDLENLYRETTSQYDIPSFKPLQAPAIAQASSLGGSPFFSALESQQSVEEKDIDNAYDLYFEQKKLELDKGVWQDDCLGLGVYHFVMAQKFHAIQTVEELLKSKKNKQSKGQYAKVDTDVLKFHDGYASGNIAFKAYGRALNYLSHCRSIEGANFFMAQCHEGRGRLMISNRVGDPWEVGENYKRAAVQRAKEEFLSTAEICGPESNQVFYQLIGVTDSRNLEEVVRWVREWQHSAERYKSVVRWVEEVKATQEPRFKKYEQDLSTAVAHYQKISKEVTKLRDKKRNKLAVLLEKTDELQSAWPSGSSRRKVPCEEENGEQAF